MSEDGILNGFPADSATPTPAVNPSQGQPAGGGDWLTSLPEDLRGVAEHKGWKDPSDALRSYQHLESVFGADKAGRAVVMPRDSDDKEGHEALYKALGRPDEVGGYELAGLFGDEAVDENVLGTMSQAMHEAGLSKAQAQKLAGAYQELFRSSAEEYQAREEAEYAAGVEEVLSSFKRETIEQAQRGFRKFGLPKEEGQAVSQAIERALGVKTATELFARLGRAVGEDRGLDGAGTAAFGGAKVAMDQLLNDEAFVKRYTSGDPGAIARIEELSIRIAEQNK